MHIRKGGYRLILGVALAGLVTVLGSVAFCEAAASEKQGAEGIPFEIRNYKILMKGKLPDGQEGNFLLDTAAEVTVFNKKLIGQPWVKITGAGRIRGIGGIQTVPQGNIASLILGDQTIKPVAGHFMDLELLGKRFATDLTGIIGTNILEQFHLEMNFGERKVRLHLPNAEDVAAGAQKFKFVRNGNSIYVPVTINGKEVGNFLLDTGADTSSISGQLVKQLGLKTEASSGEDRAVGAVGTAPILAYVHIETFAVGNQVVKNMSCHVASRHHGLLGNDFISRFSVFIDYRHNSMALVPSGKQAPAEGFVVEGDVFTRHKYGVSVTRPGADWEFVTGPYPGRVVALHKKGAAADALVLALPMTGLTFEQMKSWTDGIVGGGGQIKRTVDEVNGKKAYVLFSDHKTKSGEVNTVRQFYMVEGDYVFSIRCCASANEYAKVAGEFDKVMGSLRFAPR